MNEPSSPRFGVFASLYLSFYSVEFYRDVANSWSGKIMTLTMVLCLINAVDLCSRTYIHFQKGLLADVAIISKSLPELQVRNGKLMSIHPDSRNTINNPGSPGSLLVIDTSKRELARKDCNTKYLLSEDQLLVFDSNNKTEQPKEWSLKTFAVDWDLTGQQLPALAATIALACTGLLFLAIVCIMPLILLANALAIGGLVKLFRSERSLWESVRLSIASTEPAIIVGAILDPICAWSGVADAVPDAIARVLGLVYLVVAFRNTAASSGAGSAPKQKQ